MNDAQPYLCLGKYLIGVVSLVFIVFIVMLLANRAALVCVTSRRWLLALSLLRLTPPPLPPYRSMAIVKFLCSVPVSRVDRSWETRMFTS